MSTRRLISYERLTTPSEHLGVLLEPEAATLHAMIATGHGPALGSTRLLDTSVGALRAQLRRRLRLATPVILTGQQAEFCHAGVLAKTVAVDALAARVGGTGASLTVDSDVPKATRLVVPHVVRSDVRRGFVAIPGCDPRLPLEWQPRVPAAQWRQFFDKVAEMFAGDDTLLRSYAGGVFDGHHDVLDICTVVSRGQAAVAKLLGLDVAPTLRASQLSQTPEFRAFVAHLMLHARRFAEDYNQAQRAYRRRRRQRNPQRPAPLLAVSGQRFELPLWVGRAGQARRRLFVVMRGEHVELFADNEAIGSESVSRLRCAENHAHDLEIEGAGWHLRPRALTLSAFARLFLADLFVHGIGGAKYDEMTEDFVRRFFGVDLPAACCVTATAYLPLPRYGVGPEALAAARHARRDLRFNPQRHLGNLPPTLLTRREELIRAAQMLRLERHAARAERRRVFDEIRAVNQELLRYDVNGMTALERQWRLVEDRQRSDNVAFDREYFFALHPRAAMAELGQRIRAVTVCPETST